MASRLINLRKLATNHLTSRIYHERSSMSDDLLSAIRDTFPRLNHEMHKGQAGRIGVIGGSKEYTGAPYFAAISALRAGADLSHVFCPAAASVVIKSYSPDLIVHPVLDALDPMQQLNVFLPRLHALVVGPGLGREENSLELFGEMIFHVRELDIPVVIDADGLYYLTRSQEVMKLILNNRKVILTPNAHEILFLYKSMNVEHVKGDVTSDATYIKELAGKLGGVTIVQKGAIDIISNGDRTLFCREKGSPRRCGGQGDVLSGVMALFSHWSHAATKTSVCNHVDEGTASLCEDVNKGDDGELAVYGPALCAAYGACALTRRCNRSAYEQCKRSTLTSDMVNHIQHAMAHLFSE